MARDLEEIYDSESHMVVRLQHMPVPIMTDRPIYISAAAHGPVIGVSFMLSVPHARKLADQLRDVCDDHDAQMDQLAAAKREHDAMERA